jgi:hypothetical protein
VPTSTLASWLEERSAAYPAAAPPQADLDALGYAAYSGHTDVVSDLMEADADIHATNQVRAVYGRGRLGAVPACVGPVCNTGMHTST